jgi:hypothetical protein
MRLWNAHFCVVILACSLVVSGCAIPHYDVPYTNPGYPSVKTIIARIQCEIRDLVRTDITDPTHPSKLYGAFLRNWDMDVLIAMSIDVNDTGGLTPTLSYMDPPLSFVFSANGTLSESRDHTFTENLQYSVRQIYIDWYAYNLALQAGIDPVSLGVTAHECPTIVDTNLAGTLGIADFVAMAASSEGLDATTAPDKIFGGTIQFLVTKNVNAVGPTWTLVHFKGPGGFAGLSQVNTDKITLSFAQGPNIGKPMILPTFAQLKKGFVPIASARPTNWRAYMFLQQQLTGGIGTQLNNLQNGLQNGVR